MPVHRTDPNPATQPDGGPPKTSGIKVIGWLLVVCAIVPAAMAAHGEGRSPLLIGLALLVIGAGLVVAARSPRSSC